MSVEDEIEQLQAKFQGITFGLELLLGSMLDGLAASRPDGDEMLLRMIGAATAEVDDFMVDIMPPVVDASYRDIVRATMTDMVRGAFLRTRIGGRIDARGEGG